MATMKQVQKHFASIVELAHDQGLIGSILRKYPDWFWKAADKSAEQDADYQIKHDDPARLPLPDPWHFLMGLRDVPDPDKAIFRAAQSQLVALRHLNRIRMGIATTKSDWHREALRARTNGDANGFAKAADRIANGLWQFERVSETLKQYSSDNPGLLESAREWKGQRRRQLVHHGKSDELDKSKPWPAYSEFRDQNKLPALLVEWWVRQGVNGAPGFMFWRNQALAKFLQLRFNLPETALPPSQIKKERQRLGLISVSKVEHLIWSIKMKKNADGNFTVEGLKRNGATVFKGIIPHA
jgi:hypothetical protein